MKLTNIMLLAGATAAAIGFGAAALSKNKSRKETDYKAEAEELAEIQARLAEAEDADEIEEIEKDVEEIAASNEKDDKVKVILAVVETGLAITVAGLAIWGITLETNIEVGKANIKMYEAMIELEGFKAALGEFAVDPSEFLEDGGKA